MWCTDTAFPKAGHGLRPFSGLFRLTVEKALEKAKEVEGMVTGPHLTHREAHGQSLTRMKVEFPSITSPTRRCRYTGCDAARGRLSQEG